MTIFISYIRVSTAAQGRTGLGLDAQRQAVASFVATRSGDLLAEFVEIETGKGSNAIARRPELAAALIQAKRMKATLVITKLDRLARNVHFISGLMEAGVDFVAVDMPEASRLTLHVMAAFAEHERDMISKRTKEALSAAKARGIALGTHGRIQAQRNKAQAITRLTPASNHLRELKAQGMSLRAIASHLNTLGIASPGGGQWYPMNAKGPWIV